MTVYYLRDVSESAEIDGETVTLVLGPRGFRSAQEEAGALIVWLEPGKFRLGNVMVELAGK